MPELLSFPLPLSANLLLFGLATALIWIAGTRMVIYADEMAERFGLTRAFLGLVFLAVATELPEIVTTLSGARTGNAPLVLGNLFGGITMQTAILAVADFFFVRRALTSWPRKPTHALEAVLLILFLNILLIISLLGEVAILPGIGLGALALFLGYPVIIAMLHRFDRRDTWAPIDMPQEEEDAPLLFGRGRRSDWPNRRLLVSALLAALVILLAGHVAADRAGAIAEQTGISASFVGLALLAAATSMPELSTTIAAARMGAYTMAISNIFGSNLIMLALILPADLAYRPGPILAEVDDIARFSLLTGMLVTGIYVAGLLIRRTPRAFGAGVDSILVFAIYLSSLFVLYKLQTG